MFLDEQVDPMKADTIQMEPVYSLEEVVPSEDMQPFKEE